MCINLYFSINNVELYTFKISKKKPKLTKKMNKKKEIYTPVHTKTDFQRNVMILWLLCCINYYYLHYIVALGIG